MPYVLITLFYPHPLTEEVLPQRFFRGRTRDRIVSRYALLPSSSPKNPSFQIPLSYARSQASLLLPWRSASFTRRLVSALKPNGFSSRGQGPIQMFCRSWSEPLPHSQLNAWQSFEDNPGRPPRTPELPHSRTRQPTPSPSVTAD